MPHGRQRTVCGAVDIVSTLLQIEISSLLLWISERWQQCVAHAWVECDVTLNLSGLLQSWVEWNSTSSHSYLLMTFMHDWSWKFTSNNFRAAARIDKSDESPHSPIEQLCPNTVVPADTMSIQIGGSDSLTSNLNRGRLPLNAITG